MKEIIQLEVLAFGPHPDDVEACCAGFLIKYARMGKKVGIVDLSMGELATNGTPEVRIKEAEEAGKIIGVSVRENLGISDEALLYSTVGQEKIVEVVRKYRPEIVLVPYWEDRHPGHESASRVISSAIFAAGLRKVGAGGDAHRPKYVFYYRLWNEFRLTFILDISDEFMDKERALLAHVSQFRLKDASVPTKNHENDFIGYWRARHRNYGYEIGVEYGEPYLSVAYLGVKDLGSVLGNYS